MLRWLAIVPVLVACLSASWPPMASAREPAGTAEERFELEIRPVLTRTCFPCHGGKKTSGGLRVDSREALLKGGEGGPSIVPGRPDQSLLLRAIRHDDETLKMPPSKRLPEETVAAFTRWVKEGANWPAQLDKNDAGAGFHADRHWAFQPIKSVKPPADPTGWSSHPVDRFLAAKYRIAGVKPVADADRRTLLRRVTFDLIGLPPTPEEIESFLSDERPDAFARVVERLLASPHYGERWGRHWMDVVRYADTAGDNADYPVPEAARYRDYIIDSFNADKPYDQFVREQLAGDILARQGPAREAAEKIVATGFLALSRRYATAPFELWHLTLEDTIDTTGRAFLGLTLRCARCHDHKFDPVTQRDYYALYGIFASTRFPYAGSEEFVIQEVPAVGFRPPGAGGSGHGRSRSSRPAAQRARPRDRLDREERRSPAGRAPEREGETEAIRHPAGLALCLRRRRGEAGGRRDPAWGRPGPAGAGRAARGPGAEFPRRHSLVLPSRRTSAAGSSSRNGSHAPTIR